MKKLRERGKLFRFHAFDYTVRVILTNDIVRSHRRCKFLYQRDDLDKAAAIHSYDAGGHSYIFLPENPGIDVTVHECWHAIYRMMHESGVEIENEVVAYHLGWLVEQAVAFILKRKPNRYHHD